MLENYINYLMFINQKITAFFDKQKPYIFCEKGCAKCCKSAEFPYSKIESEFLKKGLNNLDEETQKIVKIKIQEILKNKKEFKGENFKYDCPFLINDVCSVYDYRGLICRTFGLITKGEDGRLKTPFCCYQGLNYSNVYDEKTQELSSEKVRALGLQVEPTYFNVSYDFLTHEDFEKMFNFKFGEKKPMIEWFEENQK